MKEQSQPFFKSACLAAYYAAFSLLGIFSFVWVIFFQSSLLYFILIVPFSVYSISMLIEVDAFATAALLIANFTKYRKIHTPTPINFPSLEKANEDSAISSRRTSRLSERQEFGEQQPEETIRVVRKERDRSVVKRVWGQSAEKGNWLTMEEVESAYKRQRNLFKMTQTQLVGKNWKIDDLECIIQYSKESYQLKIIAILNKLENKIIEFFDTLERYYDVAITSGNDRADDLKSVCVTPEEAYIRVEHYERTRVLPWMERVVGKQAEQSDPAAALLNLYKEILVMDRILSPFAQLNHQTRMEKISLIKKEMKEVASLNVFYCVVGIYNAEKEYNRREQLFLLKENDAARLSLDIRWYNDKLMTSLVFLQDQTDRQAKTGKEEESKPLTFYSQPGELNIWNTIGWTKLIHRNTQPKIPKKALRRPN